MVSSVFLNNEDIEQKKKKEEIENVSHAFSGGFSETAHNDGASFLRTADAANRNGLKRLRRHMLDTNLPHVIYLHSQYNPTSPYKGTECSSLLP